jgi:hypothetical protein
MSKSKVEHVIPREEKTEQIFALWGKLHVISDELLSLEKQRLLLKRKKDYFSSLAWKEITDYTHDDSNGQNFNNEEFTLDAKEMKIYKEAGSSSGMDFLEFMRKKMEEM